jgi:hypothetical protein
VFDVNPRPGVYGALVASIAVISNESAHVLLAPASEQPGTGDMP